jgi:hypothetical protein
MLILENDLHAHIIVVIDNTLDFPFYLYILYSVYIIQKYNLLDIHQLNDEAFKDEVVFL